jgi:hypothetical protein
MDMVRKKRSTSLQKRIDKSKAEARKRVVKRGIMHFRCDEEMMDHLLQVAAFKKLPVGSMVRSWVAEKLRDEYKTLCRRA